MRISVNKFMVDLDKIERDIAKKNLPDPSPPPTPTLSNFSNPPKKQLVFKKRDPPKFSGEAGDYPRFKKLWKAVADQFDDTNQLQLVLDCVPKSVQSKIKTCQVMKDVWTRLESDFGRPDQVALALLDGFAKMTLTQKSKHDNFIQLFDKF